MDIGLELEGARSRCPLGCGDSSSILYAAWATRAGVTGSLAASCLGASCLRDSCRVCEAGPVGVGLLCASRLLLEKLDINERTGMNLGQQEITVVFPRFNSPRLLVDILTDLKE
jgi:hypothetical protein